MLVRPTKLHIPLAQTHESQASWLTSAGRLVENLRPVWVAALMPLFVFGEGRFLLFGVLGVIGFWALAGMGTCVWGRWSLSSASLLVFLLLIPVTMWVTPSPDLTREHLGYLLAQLVAFFTVATWANTEQRAKVMAQALVGIGCLLAVTAPLTIQSTDPLASARLLPETIQKNVLGGTLAVLLPLCVGLLMGKLSKGAINRAPTARFVGARLIAPLLLAALAVALIVVGVIFSQSHGAYLAMVISLLVIAAVRMKPLRLIIPGGLLVTGIGVWLLNLGPSLLQLLQSDSVGDFSVRVEIWSRALQVIHDFPLTGIGLGAFRTAVPALYPYVISDPEKVHHAHNLYLQIGAELGLPGQAAFAALIISLFLRRLEGWKVEKLEPSNLPTFQPSNAEMAWLNLGCLGALVALLSHGLLDAVTWGTKPAFIAWAVLGLLLSLSLQNTRARIIKERSPRV